MFWQILLILAVAIICLKPAQILQLLIFFKSLGSNDKTMN